jgi:hypothetical protein
MRSINPLGYALSGSAILALLAGCSGGSPSSPTPAAPNALLHQPVSRSIDASSRRNAAPESVLRPSVVRVSKPDLSPGFVGPDAVTAAIIVSDSGTNDVYAYSTKGKLVATLTGFSEPQGMGGTKAGSFYVANTGDSNILLYSNAFKKTATLKDPNQYPVGASYDEATGVVGVTNIISTSDGPGSVSFYAAGKTTPCATVSNSDWGRIYFGAFNSRGDLFIDGEDPDGNVLVGKITGECSAKSITTLSVGNTIFFPGGVQVTKQDKIVIDDQEGAAVYTYNPPVKGSLGQPVATTPLSDVSDPVTFALTNSVKDLWTADAGLAASQEFAYPAGGSAIATISGLTEPIGVVVTPAEVP